MAQSLPGPHRGVTRPKHRAVVIPPASRGSRRLARPFDAGSRRPRKGTCDPTCPSGYTFAGCVLCTATDGAFTAQVAPGVYHVTAYEQPLPSSFPAGTIDLVDALKIP